MDSSVKMMEVDESPIKEPTPTIRSNGEVNGSCDDGSMDTCSSPTSSQQPADSANSNDSSRFTEIQQQKVPTSEVPASNDDEEPMEDDDEEDEDGEAGSVSDSHNSLQPTNNMGQMSEDGERDEDDEDDEADVDEHTGDTDRSRTHDSEKVHQKSDAKELANGTEEEDDDEEDNEDEEDIIEDVEDAADDINDAISVDSGSSDEPQIESVNLENSDSEDEGSDGEHSDANEVHSDGLNRNSEDGDNSGVSSGDKQSSNKQEKRERKIVKSNDSSGDVQIVENDSERKSNGEVCSSPEIQEICDLSKDKDESSEVSNLDTSSGSNSSKKKKKTQPMPEQITPRRSSRNLNKQKSYVEPRDDEMIDSMRHNVDHDDDDIEEITPDDPLGCADPVVHHVPLIPPPMRERPRPTSMSGGTIVVKDTKRLVEIANTSKPLSTSIGGSSTGGKKEPTLVIIDTNSILSGRGPVPVTHNKPTNMSATSYSVLPMALPAQGVYPPNMRATITPIPMQHKQHHQQQQQQHQHHQVHHQSSQQQLLHHAQSSSNSAAPQPNILPSLTDDMYVVEAPSFIVPYVYEKPPLKPLKEFVVQYGKDVVKAEKELANKDKAEKQKPTKSEDGDDSDSESKKENGTSDDSNDATVDKDKIDLSKDADYEALLDAKTVTADLKKTDSANNQVKSSSYFDNPLGKFFFNIGFNLVQEFVQTDLLKQQKRKRDREGGGGAHATNLTIASLIKNLEFSKENNEPYHMEVKKCDYCNFRTESALVLAHHLETPHMRNYVYRCNFCPLEVRSPHDILFHMEAEHNTRGRLERAQAFHQCPNCPFEDNQKGKLSRHLIACAKKFKPEKNLEPPVDWEPPAKIPRLSRGKQVALVPGAAPYPTFTANKNIPILPQRITPTQQQQQQVAQQQAALLRQRNNNRPNIIGKMPTIRPTTGMMYRPNTTGSGQVLVPNAAYNYGANQIFTSSSSASITPASSNRNLSIPSKLVHQPSISITPLPRQSSTNNQLSINSATTLSTVPAVPMPSVKPGDPAAGKATFVICEICDGYIKDLEQLRNHMQWIHKVKIHPKMIYNRPPLNCQKCQFRFFTDQGLERHLLGSHGLVTSSMQEAANKGKDAGRCPVCGRVYQWKLLNHVARDHKITLKPAHLSYKCTVCTATFGMYKQFESHVYSAHSVVAKRVIEKKNNVSSSSSSSSNNQSSSRNSSESLLKPLKINDEITIIPQPAKPKPSTSSRSDKE